MGKHRVRKRSIVGRVIFLTLIAPAAILLTLAFLKAQYGTWLWDVETVSAPDSQCWQREYASAMQKFNSDREITFLVADLQDAWGSTRNGVVVLDPDVPCNALKGVVAHEWAHVMQHHIYDGMKNARQALDSVEVNAACVADLIYPGRRAYIGGRDCTIPEVQAAKATIDGRKFHAHPGTDKRSIDGT